VQGLAQRAEVVARFERWMAGRQFVVSLVKGITRPGVANAPALNQKYGKAESPECGFSRFIRR
jgi:hypothetical protein